VFGGKKRPGWTSAWPYFCAGPDVAGQSGGCPLLPVEQGESEHADLRNTTWRWQKMKYAVKIEGEDILVEVP
jgi:hypothetical protein